MIPIETQKLLKTLGPVEIIGELPRSVKGITQDSRLVREGFVFAARPGERAVGFDYLKDAIKNGAIALLTAEDALAGFDLPIIKVPRFRAALTTASKAIYGDPSRSLRLYGITGTNGKTSTVHILRSIFEAAGSMCAMLSTVGYWTGERKVEASLTTPDIDLINALLAEAVQAGADYAAMEVSSHALDQGRVWGLRYIGTGFSNLTVDHLDYHSTLDAYAAAKERLFRGMACNSVAAVNVNSPWGARIMRAAWGVVVTVGGEASGADLRVTVLEHTVKGGRYRLEWQGTSFEVSSPLVGLYQGENIALASALALAGGVDFETVSRGIGNLKSVPGRMEAVNCGQEFAVLVDYAHTPDALERAIRSLRPLTKGRLITLFGCGGDRDKTKRPLMGAIAAAESDMVFITSDNPRTEDPSVIAADVFAGVPESETGKVKVVVDRRKATESALCTVAPGDVLLLAGKGSEWYQEVNGVRKPYDDRIIAAEILREMGHKTENRDQ